MSVSILVLGLGNVLLRDDGAGPWIVESLKREFVFSPGVTLLEGGTLGLDLLPHLEGVGRLILVDAVKSGRRAGARIRLENEDVPRFLALKMSPHQVGLEELVAVARLSGTEPEQVVLWGIEPGRLEPGTGFTTAVARSLPLLRNDVVLELRDLGVTVEARRSSPPPPIWWTPPRAAS